MPCCWSSSSSLTVGEANKKHGLSRSSLWTRAVFMQLVIIAVALGFVYASYRVDIARSPLRLLAAVAWLPYVTLCHVIESYVSLFLPLAPADTRRALIIVNLFSTPPLVVVSLVVALYGHTAAFIAFGCALAVALAVLLAIWVWLDRTYGAVDYLHS